MTKESGREQKQKCVRVKLSLIAYRSLLLGLLLWKERVATACCIFPSLIFIFFFVFLVPESDKWDSNGICAMTAPSLHPFSFSSLSHGRFLPHPCISFIALQQPYLFYIDGSFFLFSVIMLFFRLDKRKKLSCFFFFGLVYDAFSPAMAQVVSVLCADVYEHAGAGLQSERKKGRRERKKTGCVL